MGCSGNGGGHELGRSGSTPSQFENKLLRDICSGLATHIGRTNITVVLHIWFVHWRWAVTIRQRLLSHAVPPCQPFSQVSAKVAGWTYRCSSFIVCLWRPAFVDLFITLGCFIVPPASGRASGAGFGEAWPQSIERTRNRSKVARAEGPDIF